MAEGTVEMTLISDAAGSSRIDRAFSARMIRPPEVSGVNISKTETSKLIDVEKSNPPSSSSENRVRSQLTRATALRCSTATPLGRPVDPEV